MSKDIPLLHGVDRNSFTFTFIFAEVEVKYRNLEMEQISLEHMRAN
jgi:hypothetical protein